MILFVGELGLGERHALPVDVHVSVDGQTRAGNAETVFELEEWQKLAYWYEWMTRKIPHTLAICDNPVAIGTGTMATEVGVGVTGTTTFAVSVVDLVSVTPFVVVPIVVVGAVPPDVIVVPTVVVGERTASACTSLLIATNTATTALERLTILKGVGVKDCGVHKCTKKPKFFGWKKLSELCVRNDLSAFYALSMNTSLLDVCFGQLCLVTISCPERTPRQWICTIGLRGLRLQIGSSL